MAFGGQVLASTPVTDTPVTDTPVTTLPTSSPPAKPEAPAGLAGALHLCPVPARPTLCPGAAAPHGQVVESKPAKAAPAKAGVLRTGFHFDYRRNSWLLKLEAQKEPLDVTARNSDS